MDEATKEFIKEIDEVNRKKREIVRVRRVIEMQGPREEIEWQLERRQVKGVGNIPKSYRVHNGNKYTLDEMSLEYIPPVEEEEREVMSHGRQGTET